MVVVEIGQNKRKVKMAADLMAAYYHEDAFDTDIMGNLTNMGHALETGNMAGLSSMQLSRMMWAMAKNAAIEIDGRPERDFPQFRDWLKEMKTINFMDGEMLQKVIEEAMRGFFHLAEA